MIFETRIPAAPLDAFVEYLWLYDDFAPLHTKEKFLPDASMELIIDLREHPKRLFHHDYSVRRAFRHSWLSGMQQDYLVIDSSPGSMMGAHFRPGGAWPFFARPLSEFAGQVVELESVIGRESDLVRDQLLSAPSANVKLSILERWLLRVGGDRLRPDPTVSFALERLMSLPVRLLVRELADAVGVSHKHLIQRFDCRIGMTPKQLDRVLRFQRAVRTLAGRRHGDVDWAALALDCGYYDQAHFINEFRQFSGITPTSYRKQMPQYANFLVVDPPSATSPESCP